MSLMSRMEKLMLIFFDCEFTELGIDPKLISIGLISEDGTHEFYAELSDAYMPADCSAFVQEAVLPHLQGGDALVTMRELSVRFTQWLALFQEPVQLATDSLAWDWMWIEEIYAEAGEYLLEGAHVLTDIKDSPSRLESISRPAYVDGKPFILSQSPQFNLAVELAFRDHVPRLRRHHALDDAKANRLAWLAANYAKANEPKRIERFVG